MDTVFGSRRFNIHENVIHSLQVASFCEIIFRKRDCAAARNAQEKFQPKTKAINRMIDRRSVTSIQRYAARFWYR